MSVAAFSDYLPLPDLWKILAACVAVALVAPAAVSLAVVGLDRRSRASAGGGVPLVAAGVLVLAGLIAAGLYALFTD